MIIDIFFRKEVTVWLLVGTALILTLGSCNSARKLGSDKGLEDITYALAFPSANIKSEDFTKVLNSFLLVVDGVLLENDWKESYKPLISVGVERYQDTTRITLTANSNYARLFNSPDRDMENSLISIDGVMNRAGYQVRISGQESIYNCTTQIDKCCLLVITPQLSSSVDVHVFKTKEGDVLYDDRIYIRELYFVVGDCSIVHAPPQK